MRNEIITNNGKSLRWIHYAELSSTQLGMQDLLKEISPPLILTASRQEAGRGRMERHWESPLGNFYGTLALTYSGQPYQALLELAVLTVDFLRLKIPEVLIKWPNDIVVNDEKIAGLLGAVHYVGPQPVCLLGLGINVNLEPEGPVRYRATSIKKCTGIEQPIGDFRREYVNYLAANLFTAESPDLWIRFNEMCGTLGRKVSLQYGPHDYFRGIARGIDKDFALIIEDENKKQRVFSSGDCWHLTRC